MKARGQSNSEADLCVNHEFPVHYPTSLCFNMFGFILLYSIRGLQIFIID